MANNMVFKAQRCKVNGVAVPGIVRVGVNPRFVAVARPVISDLPGHANADRSIHGIDGTIEFEDGTLTTGKDKLVTLITTTPTSAGLLFHTAESGLATYTKHEIGANANTPLRIHGGSFVSRFDQVARFTARYAVSHNTAAVSWVESWKQTRNRSQSNMDTDAPFVAAVRIGPLTALTAGGVSPATLTGLSYNIDGVLARSSAGDFLGEVVDVVGYNITGAVSFKDHDTASHFAYQMLVAAASNLEATFREHGSTDTRVLTIKNVSFEPGVQNTYDAQGGHAEFTVPFSAGWDGTNNTLDQLISWAD